MNQGISIYNCTVSTISKFLFTTHNLYICKYNPSVKKQNKIVDWDKNALLFSLQYLQLTTSLHLQLIESIGVKPNNIYIIEDGSLQMVPKGFTILCDTIKIVFV